MQVLVVDGANVVGSRPDGWWRDRAGAAERLQQQLAATSLAYDEVVLVLEGAARAGGSAGREGPLTTLHAPRSGDDTIVEVVADRLSDGSGRTVHVVTADRGLRRRVEEAGGSVLSPSWLLERL